MRIKKFLCAALAIAGLMTSADVSAQTRWKGTNADNLANGNEIFLYNVGTGRFIVHGGDWGSQARLFNEDYGKLMTVYKSGSTVQIRTGIETTTNATLGCNVPYVTTARGWNDKTDGGVTQTLTVLMDAHGEYDNERTGSNRNSGTRSLHFVRVEDAGNTDTYTYYIYETLGSINSSYYNRNTNFYIGAVYGENGSDTEFATTDNPTGAHDGDPVGKLCLLSSSLDKVVWSTAVPGTNTEYACGVKNASLEGLDEGTTSTNRSMETAVPIFNADTKTPISDLYKWRIVTRKQFEDAIDGTADITDGLSANLTWMVSDRGFERSDNSFFDGNVGWKTGRVSGVTYTNSYAQNNGYRYGYTWGCTASGGTTQNQLNSEPWNAPVRLKAEFTDGYKAKAEAKYGFMEFEGAGTVSTSITAPVAGVYKISAWGFYSGANEAYLFATTTNPQVTSGNNIPSSSSFTKVALEKVTESPWLNADKKNRGDASNTATHTKGVMDAGIIFLNNYNDKARYLREVEITLAANQTVWFGVGKDGATKCDANSSISGNAYDARNGNAYYYHDTDWVGVDQFQIHYLGTAPAKLLDEDKTIEFSNSNYLGTTEYTNRTVRLHRTFQKDKWNSFVLPLDMTAVQVRSAFGDDARVAELKGIGVSSLSNNANIIDFATIELPAEGSAIKAGKFYLIMPTKLPTAGTSATENKDYYTLGTYTFSSGTLAKIDESTQYDPEAGSLNADGHNSIQVRGTYYSSLNYEDTSLGNKNPDTDGAYVPSGSYVIGMKDGKYAVYYTKNDLKTKGFRAWIIDVDAHQQAKSYLMAINGVSDETDGIDNLFDDDATTIIPQNGNIFDLSGRKMAVNANKLGGLPKGIYIVNGKKYIVK